MKYSLKQAWFNLGTGFSIIDEKGREAFRVAGGASGSVLGTGEKLSFRDRDDTELAFISQKILSSGPAYEIYHGDDLQAVVKRDALSSSKTCQFRAEGPSPDDLHAEGNFAGREYTFTREGKPVGRVSKAFFAANGTYGVEVGRGEDEVLLLASAVVIDLCCQHKSK